LAIDWTARIYGRFRGSWILKNSDAPAFLNYDKLSDVPEKLATHAIDAETWIARRFFDFCKDASDCCPVCDSGPVLAHRRHLKANSDWCDELFETISASCR